MRFGKKTPEKKISDDSFSHSFITSNFCKCLHPETNIWIKNICFSCKKILTTKNDNSLKDSRGMQKVSLTYKDRDFKESNEFKNNESFRQILNFLNPTPQSEDKSSFHFQPRDIKEKIRSYREPEESLSTKFKMNNPNNGFKKLLTARETYDNTSFDYNNTSEAMRLNLERVKSNLNRRPDPNSSRERSFLNKSTRKSPSPPPSKNKPMSNYNGKSNLIQQVKKTAPKPKINHNHSHSQYNFKKQYNRFDEENLSDLEYLRFNKIGKNLTFHEKNLQNNINNTSNNNISFNNEKKLSKNHQDLNNGRNLSNNQRNFHYNGIYKDYKNFEKAFDENDNFNLHNNSQLNKSGRDLTPPQKLQNEKMNFGARPKSALRCEKEFQEISGRDIEGYDRLDFIGAGNYKNKANRDGSAEKRSERSLIDEDSNYVKMITNNSSVYKKNKSPYPNIFDSSSEDIRKSAHHKKNKSDISVAARAYMYQNYINRDEKPEDFRPSKENSYQFYGENNERNEQIKRAHNHPKKDNTFFDSSDFSKSREEKTIFQEIINEKTEENYNEYYPHVKIEINGLREAYSINAHRNFIYDIKESQGRLWSASSDYDINVWNILDHELEFKKNIAKHKRWVHCLLKIENQDLILSGSADKTIKIWDQNNFEEIQSFRGHNGTVASMMEMEDERICSGSGDETIKIWNLEKVQCERTLHQHSRRVNSLSYIEDQIFLSGSEDKLIKLWDLRNDGTVKDLKGHEAGVTCLSYFNNYEMFSGSLDGTIKKWDLRQMQIVKTYEMEAEIYACCKINENSDLLFSSNAIMKYDQKKDEVFELENTSSENSIRCLEYSYNSKMLYSASNCSITCWNIF